MGNEVTKNFEVCCGKGFEEQKVTLDDTNASYIVDEQGNPRANTLAARRRSAPQFTEADLENMPEVDKLLLLKYVIKIQSVFRGIRTRKEMAKRSEVSLNSF